MGSHERRTERKGRLTHNLVGHVGVDEDAGVGVLGVMADVR